MQEVTLRSGRSKVRAVAQLRRGVRYSIISKSTTAECAGWWILHSTHDGVLYSRCEEEEKYSINTREKVDQHPHICKPVLEKRRDNRRHLWRSVTLAVEMISTSFPTLPRVWANIICAVVIALERKLIFQTLKEVSSCDDDSVWQLKYPDVAAFLSLRAACGEALHLRHIRSVELIGEICKIW